VLEIGRPVEVDVQERRREAGFRVEGAGVISNGPTVCRPNCGSRKLFAAP
jgi:hypothetical protein